MSRAAENGSRPIVYPVPYRTYAGHKADVIDLAWSKANFLLSASIDKTVRLWYEWMSTRKQTEPRPLHSPLLPPGPSLSAPPLRLAYSGWLPNCSFSSHFSFA